MKFWRRKESLRSAMIEAAMAIEQNKGLDGELALRWYVA